MTAAFEAVAVRELTPLHPEWPEQLDIASPPVRLLYAMGDPACLRVPLCAVVGTRLATDYGDRIARQLVTALVSAGVGIVSGLARGIDAAAHRAALAAGGRTIAVLGTGIDVPYPAGHRALHEQIAAHGLVLSEYGRGVRATPGCFPKRNRIIAALARVTVVIEAGHRSGALNTANAALDADRLVAAVPGPIDAPQSAGANALIASGAHVVTCAADILSLLGVSAPPSEEIERALRGDALAVWRALERDALFCEDLATAANLPFQRVLSAVSDLEVAGHVSVGLDDRVRRTVPVNR